MLLDLNQYFFLKKKDFKSFVYTFFTKQAKKKRIIGFEPILSTWKVKNLPLIYIRKKKNKHQSQKILSYFLIDFCSLKMSNRN